VVQQECYVNESENEVEGLRLLIYQERTKAGMLI
jgi:hypothetical protein